MVSNIRFNNQKTDYAGMSQELLNSGTAEDQSGEVPALIQFLSGGENGRRKSDESKIRSNHCNADAAFQFQPGTG